MRVHLVGALTGLKPMTMIAAAALLAGCADHPTASNSDRPNLATVNARAWTLKAPMPTGRARAAAVTAPDQAGHSVIYVFGGLQNGEETNVVEVYDPATDSWSSRTPMPDARFSMSGAVYLNGQIYVLGGWHIEDSNPLSTMLIYTIATDSWQPGGIVWNMAEGPSGVILGKIYAISGNDGAGILWFDRYDPVLGEWTVLKRALSDHQLSAGGVLNDKFYVTGGMSYNPAANRTNEAYDPAKGTWKKLAPMPVGRFGHSVAALNGKLYIIGGTREASWARVDVYHPVSNTWGSGPAMPNPTAFMSVGTYRDASGHDVAFLIGGNGQETTNRMFDPSAGQ